MQLTYRVPPPLHSTSHTPPPSHLLTYLTINRSQLIVTSARRICFRTWGPLSFLRHLFAWIHNVRRYISLSFWLFFDRFSSAVTTINLLPTSKWKPHNVFPSFSNSLSFSSNTHSKGYMSGIQLSENYYHQGLQTLNKVEIFKSISKSALLNLTQPNNQGNHQSKQSRIIRGKH